MRILHEFDYCKEGRFITLTYSDDMLPLNGGLVKSHVQLFVKKLRNKNSPFKYYCSGEYGELKGRPHYHMIFLGKLECNVEELWGRGNVYIGTVTRDSINYVCKYVQKKIYGKGAQREEYGFRTPPFALMSKGIGKKWLADNIDHVLQNMGIRVNGIVRASPRYYMKLIKKEFGEEVYIEIMNNYALFHQDEIGELDVFELVKRSEYDRNKRKALDNDLEWRKANIVRRPKI